MNKEQIYDEQISPLMTQIIDICKAHKIAHIASFSIPTEEDAELCCTSAQLTADFDPPEHFLRAWREIRPNDNSGGLLMLRTEDGNGGVTITAIL